MSTDLDKIQLALLAAINFVTSLHDPRDGVQQLIGQLREASVAANQLLP